MQPMPPCSAPACWWRKQASGLLLCWELQLGVPSVGFIIFFLQVMLLSEISKFPTDPFPGVWKLLFYLFIYLFFDDILILFYF